jgi:hypothetical protein
MNIEKPISTIRKAVKSSAEEQALNENIDKPEKRHYDETFKFLKIMKTINPEMFEKDIILLAKGKELKDESGIESYKVFRQVWKELTDINEVNEQVNMWNKFRENQSLPELPQSEQKRGYIILAEDFLKSKGEELKKDPRITNKFSGKEDILNRCVDHAISATLNFIENYHERFLSKSK